jgi:hypothetical protein
MIVYRRAGITAKNGGQNAALGWIAKNWSWAVKMTTKKNAAMAA